MNKLSKALTAPLFLLMLAACSSPLGLARPTTSPSPGVRVAGGPESSPGASGSSPAPAGDSPAPRSGSSGAPGGAARVDSCVVGRFISNAFSGARLGSATISGGAGVHLAISDSGDLTVDYSGMQPVQIQLASGSTGTGSLQGLAHAVITTDSGVLTPSSYDGSGVSVNAVLHSGGVDTPVNLPLGDVFGASVAENYTCDRSSVTFVRQGPLPNLVYRRQ
jgi:hypothetical protein